MPLLSSNNSIHKVLTGGDESEWGFCSSVNNAMLVRKKAQPNYLRETTASDSEIRPFFFERHKMTLYLFGKPFRNQDLGS